MNQKVSILGLGYVGLPLAIAIEECEKYEVLGFDIDESKIKQVQNKKSPFPDKDVEIRLQGIDLQVTFDDKKLKDSDIFIIAVPTPIQNDFDPNLGPVMSATTMISKYLKKGNIVIVESTINPGVCEEVVLPILEKETGLKGSKDFELAHCPERINPGDKKWNVYNISRNIGALSRKGTKQVADFYRSFLTAEINEVPSIKIAEATKIIENTFRDINIAYVNELAKSFDKLDIDLIETIKAASNKPFGFMPHWPGCGVGGHCIAVDPYYLIKRAAQSGFDHKFLKMARDVNNSMPEYTVEKLIKALNEIKKTIKDTKILLYGLSYKSNVGDLRESPALEIKEILEKMDADLSIYDPYFKKLSTVKSLEQGLNDNDALVICTSHNEIVNLDYDLFKKIKMIVDGRNCLDKERVEKMGVGYTGIGR